MNAISNFIDFMASKDCAPASSADIRATDKWTDYQLAADPKGKKKGFYILKIDGDYVSGACGDRRNGETYQFYGKPSRKLTDEERRAFAKRRDEEKKRAEAEEKERHDSAASKATAKWSKAKQSGHPYLTKKGISGNPKGRAKNVPNKSTTTAREAIASFVEGNADRLNGFLDGIANGIQVTDIDGNPVYKDTGDGQEIPVYIKNPDPQGAFNAIRDLLEYHLPKINRTEVQTLDKDGNPADAISKITIEHVSVEKKERE